MLKFNFNFRACMDVLRALFLSMRDVQITDNVSLLVQDFRRHRKTGWSFFIYDLRETAQGMSLFNYSLASTYMKIYLRLFFFLNSNHANVLHLSLSWDATASSVLARWRCLIHRYTVYNTKKIKEHKLRSGVREI